VYVYVGFGGVLQIGSEMRESRGCVCVDARDVYGGLLSLGFMCVRGFWLRGPRGRLRGAWKTCTTSREIDGCRGDSKNRERQSAFRGGVGWGL